MDFHPYFSLHRLSASNPIRKPGGDCSVTHIPKAGRSGDAEIFWQADP
jgi:hypothetical protein